METIQQKCSKIYIEKDIFKKELNIYLKPSYFSGTLNLAIFVGKDLAYFKFCIYMYTYSYHVCLHTSDMQLINNYKNVAR